MKEETVNISKKALAEIVDGLKGVAKKLEALAE